MQFNSRTKIIKLTVQEQRRLAEARDLAFAIARNAPPGNLHDLVSEAATAMDRLSLLGAVIDLNPLAKVAEPPNETPEPARKRAS